MLNQQQLTEALAFQSFKSMQLENMAAQLEQHCKSLLEELQLLKKQNEEQQDILQKPAQDEERIISLRADLFKAEQALRCIAYVDGPKPHRQIAREAVEKLFAEPNA